MSWVFYLTFCVTGRARTFFLWPINSRGVLGSVAWFWGHRVWAGGGAALLFFLGGVVCWVFFFLGGVLCVIFFFWLFVGFFYILVFFWVSTCVMWSEKRVFVRYATWGEVGQGVLLICGGVWTVGGFFFFFFHGFLHFFFLFGGVLDFCLCLV